MESSEPSMGLEQTREPKPDRLRPNGACENGSTDDAGRNMRKTITPKPTMTKNKKKKTEKKKKNGGLVLRLGCLGWSDDYPTAYASDGGFTVEIDPDCTRDHRLPAHLVVTVNGIIGSAGNWRFAAKQLLNRYPEDVVVHCSECNSSILTLDGVDVMGERLAKEVISVIKSRPELQKISFVAHSLGGLIARYAIARLYGKNPVVESPKIRGGCANGESGNPFREEKSSGKLAGLEPQNFITFATPHLGSRGHKQVPAFCSLHFLEKSARYTSRILGRTGKHLFLTDNDNGKPPLLLQMVNDCGDLQFMSALQSFKRRVAYANTCSDVLVGWKTSSIRRQEELPKRHTFSKNDKYPHIVNVEMPKIENSEVKDILEMKVKGHKTDDMEEAMIRGLTRVSWERVDVSFRGSSQRIFAHSTIQVKTKCINSDGADVILHMIDNFLL